MKISCVIIADSGRKITYETGRFLFTNAMKPVGGATGFDEKQQDGAAALDKWLIKKYAILHLHGKVFDLVYENLKTPP